MNREEEIGERMARMEEKVDGLSGSRPGLRIGGEYKSSFKIFGLPLIHVATGFNPETGGLRVARGIIAIGNVAIGFLALGGVALGVITFGGLALGIAAIGGFAIAAYAAVGGVAIGGYAALGGLAVAGYLAVGGLAVSWNYAIGGFAIGPHPYGSNIQDPEALEFLKRLFPGWKW